MKKAVVSVLAGLALVFSFMTVQHDQASVDFPLTVDALKVSSVDFPITDDAVKFASVDFPITGDSVDFPITGSVDFGLESVDFPLTVGVNIDLG